MAACALCQVEVIKALFLYLFIFLEREKEISRQEQHRGNNRGIHLRSQTNEANF